MKIRAGINEIENRRSMEKIKRIEGWFFEKTNKMISF